MMSERYDGGPRGTTISSRTVHRRSDSASSSAPESELATLTRRYGACARDKKSVHQRRRGRSRRHLMSVSGPASDVVANRRYPTIAAGHLDA